MQRQYDTRNHRFARQQSHIQYDMRKFSFPNRIIPLWNSLPDYVVSSLLEIHLKHVWIDFGKTKRFVITGRPIYCTPEVVIMSN